MGVIENRIDITELERSGGGGGGTAASVSYDNTTSHMTATDVQAALDELNLDIAEGLALVNTSVAANRQDILNLEDDKAGTDQISNRNLLDNGWFTVNQRGKDSYTSGNSSPEYTLDRWCGIQINDKAIKPKDNYGVTIDYTGVSSQKSWFCLSQLIDAKDSASICGKSVTISIKVSNIQNMADNEPLSVRIYDSNDKNTFPSGGLIHKLIVETDGISSATFSVPSSLTTGNLLIAIYGSTSETEYATAKFDIDAIKLEVGSVSTLDMDAAPNYAEELLKCQRYFVRMRGGNTVTIASGFCVNGSTGSCRFTLSLPTPMRTDTITPTISSLDDFKISASDFAGGVTPTSFARIGTVFGCMQSVELKGTGFTTGGLSVLYSVSTSAYIDISADL